MILTCTNTDCSKCFSSTVPQCPACGRANVDHPTVKLAIAKQGPLDVRIAKLRQRLASGSGPIAIPSVAGESDETIVKRAVAANDVARGEHVTKIAEARTALDVKVAALATKHKISPMRVLATFPTLRAEASDIAELEASPPAREHPIDVLAKSDLDVIKRQIDEIEQRRTDALEQYAITHRLSATEADREITKQVYADRHAGREHWRDRYDRQLEELAERRSTVRTAAAKRVEKVLVPPVDPGNVAKRRELEAELLEPHPIVKAYESYVGKYAAEHGGIKREQAISRLFGARDATFLALRDAAATAPPSPIAAAARKVLDALDVSENVDNSAAAQLERWRAGTGPRPSFV